MKAVETSNLVETTLGTSSTHTITKIANSQKAF